jgi:hypothetical protein
MYITSPISPINGGFMVQKSTAFIAGQRLLNQIPLQSREMLVQANSHLDIPSISSEIASKGHYSEFANFLESMDCKDKIILDLYCGSGAQCYFFSSFKKYIGVDPDWKVFFTGKNATFYQHDPIQFMDYLDSIVGDMECTRDDVVVMCFGHPEARDILRSGCSNVFCVSGKPRHWVQKKPTYSVRPPLEFQIVS